MSPNEDVRPAPSELGVAVPAPAPLSPDDAARLTEFARACKAAARIGVMYPDGHTAIKAALGRIVQATSPPKQVGPMRLTVMPEMMLLEDRAPAKVDTSLAELSELLHSHLIGEMTVQPGGDADAWRAFLLILARSPESVRAEGGITAAVDDGVAPRRHPGDRLRGRAARARRRRIGRVGHRHRELPAGQGRRARRRYRQAPARDHQGSGTAVGADVGDRSARGAGGRPQAENDGDDASAAQHRRRRVEDRSGSHGAHPAVTRGCRGAAVAGHGGRAREPAGRERRRREPAAGARGRQPHDRRHDRRLRRARGHQRRVDRSSRGSVPVAGAARRPAAAPARAR